MADLTADELKIVRTWVGTTPTDVTLNERMNRLGEVSLVISETLRDQLVTLGANPASLTLPSGLRIDQSKNIELLRDMLAELEGGLSGANVAELSRRDYR